MAETKPETEPSMEEILASIRRIIAEEGSEVPAEGPAGDADVYDLTEVVEGVAAGPGVDVATPDGSASPRLHETEPKEDVMPTPPTVAQSIERLVTGMAADKAASQFTSLARAAEPDPLKGVRGGRTVEELCVELLKPMLKEWLDANVPGIVERLVEREIRYLSRRPENE